MSNAFPRFGLLTAITLTLLFSRFGYAAMQTVSLPLTIDYPLLENVIISRAFPEKGDSVTLFNEGDGCIFLALSSPQVAESNGLVELDMQVQARVGTPIGGKCFTPMEWRGHLVLLEQPAIDAHSWQLSFTTEDSKLLNDNREPTQVADVLWKLIQPHIWEYISGITINLMPPVSDLKSFILPLFPQKKQEQATAMLSTMRPGVIRVTADSLHLPVLAEVENIFDPNTQPVKESLDEDELRRTITVWESWDGLLVYLLTTLARQELTVDEKRTLTNVLLDTRYRFVNELADRTIEHDIVRQQFVQVWQELSPIFRKHILRRSESSHALGYLAFFASADALLVFDRLGPTFGIEISTTGLIRLAKMLQADPNLFQYRSEINPELQELFQFVPDKTAPAAEIDKPTSSLLKTIMDVFRPATAHAGQALPTFKEILQWKVPDTDIEKYLQRVERVLQSSSASMIDKGKVPADQKKMYQHLIPAMAWQESCFRQFVVKGEKLTYLLSYNNSSVGLMQINERVWRGLYDRSRLRWDIQYNADAGSEIAAHYLTSYGLRDKNIVNILDDHTLARLIYAMYNGGPSQYKKFLARLENNQFYDSDKLFWEKYNWVLAGEINKVSICLTGR